jgi:mono/diheme cytochrome c family protein
MSKGAKIGAAVVGAIVAVIVGFLGWVEYRWNSRRYRLYEAAPPPVQVSYDVASINRGDHLANHLLGCAECHGADFGGRVFIDDPALGRFAGRNLTRGEGGVGSYLSEEDWARGIVRGVSDSHRALLIMPTRDYQNLAASDLAALIAYGRTRPAVNRDLPVAEPTLLAKVLLALDAIPSFDAEHLDLNHTLPPTPPTGRTLEHGQYVANACVGCHRPTLNGGPFPPTPEGCPQPANLTVLARDGYTEADFVRVFREGHARDGHEIDAFMPWRAMGGMSDDELLSLWDYLAQLEPIPTGS